MLIKLTTVPHPDLNDGKSQPCYIDASRVLLIVRGHFQHPKIGSVENRQKLAQDLYNAACNLTDHVGGYLPRMDDPVAVGWMHTARVASTEVQNAYQKLSYISRDNDYHPRFECTEVQLACGTALEHGVMLTRVWVTETPEEVAKAVGFLHPEPAKCDPFGPMARVVYP